jgi:hypothetical protein
VRREIVRFREEIAGMLRQGRIAWELGISQPAVCKILRRVERHVLARMEADVRAVKAKQAGRLEYIVDQAMLAWNNSKESIESRVTTDVNLVGCETAIRRAMTRQGPGDPRFLAVALQALAAERKLWGLDAVATDQPDHDGTAAPPIVPLNGRALALVGLRGSLNGRVPEGESTRNGSA